MKALSDNDIIQELNKRFSEKNRLLEEQKQFMIDLKTVNDKLIQSENIKSHFLSNIKNEVNNPMTSILGLLRFQLTGNLDHDQKQVNLKLVYKEACLLNFQLQNVFTAAEIEAGESNLEMTTFSIGELMKQSLTTLEGLFGKPGIQVNIKMDIDEKICSDRNKLSIVLLNIISNAYKFGGDDNQIDIAVQKNDQNEIVLSVQDQGVGIDEADLVFVFDRFSQLDSGTTKSFNGHGLGLSISHAFVDMMDGNIKIKSARGEGAIVTVTLPIKSASIYAQVFDDEDSNLFFVDEDEESF